MLRQPGKAEPHAAALGGPGPLAGGDGGGLGAVAASAPAARAGRLPERPEQRRASSS